MEVELQDVCWLVNLFLVNEGLFKLFGYLWDRNSRFFQIFFFIYKFEVVVLQGCRFFCYVVVIFCLGVGILGVLRF